jgi:hypothetical protein
MNAEEVIELMVNPHVQRTILRLARQEAQRIVLQHIAPKDAPRNSITYVQAADLLGLKEQTIRVYVCQGKLKGGSGYVTIASCARFKKK